MGGCGTEASLKELSGRQGARKERRGALLILTLDAGSPVVPFLVLDVVGFFMSSISSDSYS